MNYIYDFDELEVISHLATKWLLSYPAGSDDLARRVHLLAGKVAADMNSHVFEILCYSKSMDANTPITETRNKEDAEKIVELLNSTVADRDEQEFFIQIRKI